MRNYLPKYRYFTDVKKITAVVEQHLHEHHRLLTNTETAVLAVIYRYSIPDGAAHLRHATIEKEVGKSNTTVRRAIRKLEMLGIIERIHYVRPVMNGLGGNIYVIQPYQNEGILDEQLSLTLE